MYLAVSFTVWLWSCMIDCLLKLAFNASQTSFIVSFPLIFKYKKSGIINAICWKTIACSCEYWLTSFTYFSNVLTCSAVKAVDPAGLSGGASGLTMVPSKWLYNPWAWIKSSSLSFHTMKPFPSAGSLGIWRKLLPNFRSKDICNKQYSDISSSLFWISECSEHGCRAHNLKLNNNEIIFAAIHFKLIYVATQCCHGRRRLRNPNGWRVTLPDGTYCSGNHQEDGKHWSYWWNKAWLNFGI